MIFLKCLIRGFGKLERRTLEFRPGLNVVFAPNEGGKSTLQRFLLAMLYGPLRSEVRNQRRFEPWVELYRPWSGTDYGGVLWCALDGGKELEVHRNLSRDDNRIEIRTATGEDLAGRYEQQRNGDVLFARAHLGMPKDLFEAVAVIRENRAGELGGHDSIRERIANLAQSGDEETSVRVSLEKLEAALEEIGSDRAPTRPYRQVADRIEALQAEMAALASRRNEFQSWVEERNRCAASVAELESDARRAVRAATVARRLNAALRVRTLEDLEREIRTLDAQIEESGGDPDFPAQYLEELDRLTGALEAVERQLAAVRQERAAADPQLASAESMRAKLAAYEPLNAGGEADRVTEWFVGYMSANLQKDAAQRSAARLAEEIRSLEEALAGLGTAASDSGTDWEARARQASLQEGEFSRHILELSERIAVLDRRAAEARRARLRGIAAASIVLALGIVSIAFGFARSDAPAYFGFGAAALIASAVCLTRASRNNKAIREAGTGRSELEIEQAGLREKSGTAKSAVMQAASAGGYGTVDEFLGACKKAQQHREKTESLRVRLAEAETGRDRAAAEANENYTRLKQVLAGVNLSCSPATLRAQVDVLRGNLRRFRELDAQFASLDQSVSALRQKEEELAQKSEESRKSIQRILDASGVATAESYRDACRAGRRAAELAEKKSSRTREYQRLCHPLTLDQWREKLAELESAECAAAGTTPDRVEDSGEGEPHAPRLPYAPTVEEAEAEERRAGAALSSAREEYATSAERVRHAFEGYRTASEIDEDLAAARREMERLDLNRKALTLAAGTIRELSRQQQESLAPQLNRVVERRFVPLCGDRYSEVRIDPDFQIHLREAATGELRKLESLSRGTQDQLYFALRFGILELVSNSEETSPCLLDEPFAAYDGRRLEEALRVLEEESSRRQVLLFTCREDVHALAARAGHSIPIASGS